MPAVDKAGRLSAGPISYVSACMHLRRILSEVSGVAPEQYTLHSCKATVLSWALQLRLPEGDRAKQGHHRSQSTHSVALYGRDDVVQMLWVQSQVRARILAGWRPCSAQLRGALPPLAEPELTLLGAGPGTVAEDSDQETVSSSDDEEPAPVSQNTVSSWSGVDMRLLGAGILTRPPKLVQPGALAR